MDQGRNTPPVFGGLGDYDDAADDLMVRTFATCFELIDGRPNTKVGACRVERLPTTCHVYFGAVTGALW